MSSCPDWTALARRRDRDAAGETAWEGALAHLDGGCRRCAAEAHAAEPTLMFRRLPGAEVGAADVAAMREAVAAMRRAGRVAAPEPAVAALPPLTRRSRASGWRHLAAASVLAAAAAGLWLSAPEELPAGDPAVSVLSSSGIGSGAAIDALPGGAAERTRRALPAGAAFAVPGVAGPLGAARAAEPSVVELSQPRAADVYELGEGDLTLVMVVDETLDV